VQKVAVIDVGSNSIKLAVFGRNGNEFSRVGKARAKLRIAEGAEQQQAALELIQKYNQLAIDNGAEQIKIVATEATRNLPDFAKQLANLGIDYQIITGQQEAEYIGKVVQYSFDNPQGYVFDLGGGSLDICYLNEGSIKRPTSLPIGYNQNIDIVLACNQLTNIIKNYSDNIYLTGGLPKYFLEGYFTKNQPQFKKHQLNGKHARASNFVQYLQKLDARQSTDFKREEVINYAQQIIMHITHTTNAKTIYASKFGLREAIAYDLYNDDNLTIISQQQPASILQELYHH